MRDAFVVFLLAPKNEAPKTNRPPHHGPRAFEPHHCRLDEVLAAGDVRRRPIGARRGVGAGLAFDDCKVGPEGVVAARVVDREEQA